MKKILIATLFSAVLSTVSFAQVLTKPGVQNNLWTGMGVPTGTPNSSERDAFRWYGFIDTVQVRADINIFTLDGMLAWGALTEWTHNNVNDFTFVNTSKKPVDFMHQGNALINDNGRRSNAYNKGDGTYGNNSYYLNFLVHPFDGFDFGMGTRLEWSVGPNPSYGAYQWEYKSHVHQGDLRDGKPGSVPVAGYIKYSNTYAQKALAARFKNEFIEVGASIPSGFTTESPVVDFGISITPVEFLTAAFAYEALFMNDANLYTGATIRFTKDFVLDAYLAFDNLGSHYSTDGKWGTGAGFLFAFPSVGLTLRPEAGFTFYGNSDYSSAFYTGGKVNYDFAKNWHLGCWISFAWGAEQNKWHDKDDPGYSVTKDYTGGFIFNIRPELCYEINSKHSVAVTTEFQSLRDYKNDVIDSTLIGVYWRYKN